MADGAWQFWPPINVQFAPTDLTQPIFSGWQFANVINNQNSSSPKTEEDIVSRHSYGRQIGRLMDAVTAIISERPAHAPSVEAYEKFDDLRQDIVKIKQTAAKRRVETLRDDLELLKAKESPEEFGKLVRELADLIDVYGDKRRS